MAERNPLPPAWTSRPGVRAGAGVEDEYEAQEDPPRCLLLLEGMCGGAKGKVVEIARDAVDAPAWADVVERIDRIVNRITVQRGKAHPQHPLALSRARMEPSETIPQAAFRPTSRCPLRSVPPPGATVVKPNAFNI